MSNPTVGAALGAFYYQTLEAFGYKNQDLSKQNNPVVNQKGNNNNARFEFSLESLATYFNGKISEATAYLNADATKSSIEQVKKIVLISGGAFLALSNPLAAAAGFFAVLLLADNDKLKAVYEKLNPLFNAVVGMNFDNSHKALIALAAYVFLPYALVMNAAIAGASGYATYKLTVNQNPIPAA